jgi:hypothetical protein
VRTVIAVFGLVAALAVTGAPAHASNDPKLVDGIWAWRKRSIGVSFGGGASRLAGRSVGGFGPTVDLAIGDGRFQYFLEASLWWASVSGDNAKNVTGLEGRGGVGVRWLAKSFVMEGDGAIELVLEAFAGVEEFVWNRGGRLTRPDLGAGWAWQVRFRQKQFLFRSFARVYFAPSDPDLATEICRGPCTMTTPSASTWSSGLMAGMGVAW